MSTPYEALLAALAADLEPIVAEVAADVAPGDDPEVGAERVRPVVAGLVRRLSSAPYLAEPGHSETVGRAALVAEGEAAARAGEPVAGPIDRHLTAGWVLWDAATRHPLGDPLALAALGSALLRAGDAAAAAIAEGHGRADAELAGRAAAARRAFADEVFDLPPGDPAAATRLALRATRLGHDPAAPHLVVAAWIGRDVDDAGADLDRVERSLARPGRTAPIVAMRSGRVVVALPEGPGAATRVTAALGAVAGDAAWVAMARPADILPAIGAAAADALDALGLAERLGMHGRLVPIDELALERALLADPRRLAAAVERELGPLLHVARLGSGLVETLEAWLDAGQGIKATARALGIAPRTVSYRLATIERRLGRRLRGATVRRLGAALLARELLAAADRERP